MAKTTSSSSRARNVGGHSILGPGRARGGGDDAAETAGIDDREFNTRMLPLVSRTFALSILYLPPSLREAVGVSYLLCRIVDSVEDARGLAPGRRRALFDAFDKLLEDDTADPSDFEQAWQDPALSVTDAERTLCHCAGAPFRRFRALSARQRDAIRPHVAEMSRGMRAYAARADAEGQLRIRDVEDLERYCYFVAGTVGELLTALFEQEATSMDEPAREAIRMRAVPFGLGLQLVNIVKDVAEDAGRGACFLPADVLDRHGTSAERILEPADRTMALSALREVCALARRHLEAAVEYTLCWPAVEGAEVRAFCAVPLALALCTLHEVERGDDALIRGREPKVDRAMVAEILSATRRAKDADASLARLFARASEPACARPNAAMRSTGPLMRSRRPPTPPVRRAPSEPPVRRAPSEPPVCRAPSEPPVRRASSEPQGVQMVCPSRPGGPLLRARRPPTPPVWRGREH